MNLWERFDDVVKPEKVMEAKSGFDPIEPGVYKMTVEELKPDTSKNGRPMLKGRFRLLDDNRVLFYNQVLQVVGHDWLTERNIAEAIILIEGILEEKIEYKGLSDFANIIDSIPVGTVHTIEVSYDNQDEDDYSFPILTVIEDLDDLDLDSEDDDDVDYEDEFEDGIPF